MDFSLRVQVPGRPPRDRSRLRGLCPRPERALRGQVPKPRCSEERPRTLGREVSTGPAWEGWPDPRQLNLRERRGAGLGGW